MGRLDTRRWTPPVRIGLAMARGQQRAMVDPAQTERHANAAGDWGQKERRMASVPIRLRFQRHAGPNSSIAIANVKPINYTRTKRGLPPLTQVPAGTPPAAGRAWSSGRAK